ncbi:MAG: hypothetical protein P8017_08325, partial [Deltaproteobacteria bacterium]
FETIHATSIVECLQVASKGSIQGLLVLSSDDTRNLLVSHAAVRQGIENIIVTNIKEYFPGLLRVLFTLGKEKKEGHPISFSWPRARRCN